MRKRATSGHIRIQFLNLARGMAAVHGAAKAAGLAQLAKDDGYPDFIGYTELSGPAGTGNVRQWLGKAMSKQYTTMLWSQRSVKKDGKTPASGTTGGGIALLVHRRVRMSVRALPLPASIEDTALLNGHCRVFRFDPLPDNHARPLKPIIVTLAYIPPVGEWGDKIRPLMARVLDDVGRDIAELRLREDIFPFTMAHTNAPDACCDIDLHFPANQCVVRADLERMVRESSNHKGAGKHRGVLSIKEGANHLTVRRAFSAKQRAFMATLETRFGLELAQAAARNNQCTITALQNHAQSDTWQKSGVKGGGRCKSCRAGGRDDQCAKFDSKCAARNTCTKRLQLRPVYHDQLWVPSDLAARANGSVSGGADLIHSTVKRVIWAPGTPIDHAVTFARLFVGAARRVDADVGDELDAAASALESRQPKRIHFPDNLLSRCILKSELTLALNNKFEVLATRSDLQASDLDGLESRMVDALGQALDEARREHVEAPDAAEEEGKRCIKTLRRALARCQRKLHSFIDERAKKSGPSRQEKRAGRKARKLLGRQVKAAHEKLVRAERRVHGARQNNARRHKPKDYWRKHFITDKNPGEPAGATAYLLDHQNDEKGACLTANKRQCRRNLRKKCVDLYEVPSVLPSACELKVDEALAELHLENAALFLQGNIVATSAAARSAQDATAPSAASDARRNRQRNLDAALAVARARRAGTEYPLMKCTRDFSDAIAHRDRAITGDEVRSICRTLGDVGAGVDGLPPAMLSALDAGDTAEAIAAFLQRCFVTGAMPTRWCVHRTQFLFKKGDPFCLDNWRGISIDALLLKVYTLILRERAEEFLEYTKGLSRLQGGFQRLRGPPESILTLTEAVKAATRGQYGKVVELLFLDVRVAYDSVLHPLLFKRCMDHGFGGQFLAALQAVYHNASSRLDVNGSLLEAVPLARGVLQGNALSPLLFNIYLDGVITDLQALRIRAANGQLLRPVGIWLPRDASMAACAPASGAAPEDLLPCLFFADDGVLLESDHDALQAMVNQVVESLASIGLVVNTNKTKWMVVPPASYDENAYEIVKANALKNPIRVGNEAVELVDEFDYLGVRIWWRWDYTRAWKAAAQRARKCYFGALNGGWHRRAGSLAAQLDYARARIFSHFNYVAALAGAGGNATSAPWRACDDVVDWVLCAISGQHGGDMTKEALRVEAGVWAFVPRVDQMLLRMWCKSLTMAPDNVFVRAMHLSMACTSEWARSQPASANAGAGELRFQTWAQQLFAAAHRFGIPRVDVERGTPQLVRVQTRAGDADADDEWTTLEPDGGAPPPSVDASASVRLIAAPMPQLVAQRVEYVLDVNCWALPSGTNWATALSEWTPQLKAATYAALRARGNAHRDVAVQRFLSNMVADNRRLKTWAATISGSQMQPYFHLDDPHLARWILRARMDYVPTEDAYRTAPHLQFPRVEPHYLRACYCCRSIFPLAPKVFWPETFLHTTTLCAHPRLVRLRAALRSDLRALAEDEGVRKLMGAARIAAAPDFSDDSALFTAIQLCTGTGAAAPVHVLQSEPLSASANSATDPIARAELLRASPQFRRDNTVARATVEWMRILFDDWLAILRTPQRREQPQQSAGYRIAHLIAHFLKCTFAARAAALGSSREFRIRARDPAAAPKPRSAAKVAAAPIAAAAPPRAQPMSLAPTMTTRSSLLSNVQRCSSSHPSSSLTGREPRKK